MARTLIAAGISLLGLAAVVAGIAMIYLPAALVVGGTLLIAFGTFGVDTG